MSRQASASVEAKLQKSRMESVSAESISQPSPQLLSVGEKEKKRLLEVYVTRSLSLNEGTVTPVRRTPRKWITIAEQKSRNRRHSSDTSLNLKTQISMSDEDVRYDSLPEPASDNIFKSESDKKAKKGKHTRSHDSSNAVRRSNSKAKNWFLQLNKDKEESGNASDVPTNHGNTKDAHKKLFDSVESATAEGPKKEKKEKKDKEAKKPKKPTVWKSFLNWFSKGDSDKEPDQQRTEVELPSRPSTPNISCLPIPEAMSKGDKVLRRSKSLKRKSSKKAAKWRRSGDMSSGKSIEEVEHTSVYYEKVSEELEKIVHEVKDSPVDGKVSCDSTCQTNTEELARRITELIKQEGDVINDKLKKNSTVTSFLDGISYKCFQQMADQYVQSEAPRVQAHPPAPAPELVKFAFTLDFTARVANLHRQATGQIMGFGNQYLQDRFTHMSESHPHSREEQNQLSPEQEFISLEA